MGCDSPPHSHCHRSAQGVSYSQSCASNVTFLQLDTSIHPHTHLPSTKSPTLIPTQTCLVTSSHKAKYTDTQHPTSTAPNTSRVHFISNCEQMLLVFISLQTPCLPVSLAPPLPLPHSLSLSAPRQVSASIFSSSVAVKLNGIGLIAENQREG